jgi:hypothetical protein
MYVDAVADKSLPMSVSPVMSEPIMITTRNKCCRSGARLPARMRRHFVCQEQRNVALQRGKKGCLFWRDKMQRTRRSDSAMVRTLVGFTREWSSWISSLKFAARNIFAESVRYEIPSARSSGSRKPKSGSSVPLTRLRFISGNAILKVRVIPLVLIPSVLPEPTAFQTLPLR